MTKLKNLGLTYTFVLIPDNETSSRIQCFYLAPDRLTALCNDAEWCNRVTCLAKALVALSSAIPTLPKHCKIPESGQEALLQFVFVPLAVRTYLHIVYFVLKARRVNRPCEKIWRLHFTTIPCEPNTGHKVQYFVHFVHLCNSCPCAKDIVCARLKILRRNPPDVGVTSGQKSSTKIIYIVLQTSVGLC